jgi:hypothetical protein
VSLRDLCTYHEVKVWLLRAHALFCSRPDVKNLDSLASLVVQSRHVSVLSSIISMISVSGSGGFTLATRPS